MVHGYVSYVTKYEVLLLELFHSNWCQKIVLKTKTTEELFFLASYSRKRKEVFSSHFLGFQQLSRCDKFLFFTAANFSGIFCLLNSLVFWPRKNGYSDIPKGEKKKFFGEHEWDFKSSLLVVERHGMVARRHS